MPGDVVLDAAEETTTRVDHARRPEPGARCAARPEDTRGKSECQRKQQADRATAQWARRRRNIEVARQHARAAEHQRDRRQVGELADQQLEAPSSPRVRASRRPKSRRRHRRGRSRSRPAQARSHRSDAARGRESRAAPGGWRQASAWRASEAASWRFWSRCWPAGQHPAYRSWRSSSVSCLRYGRQPSSMRGLLRPPAAEPCLRNSLEWTVTAAILAGGRGSRIGGDKATVRTWRPPPDQLPPGRRARRRPRSRGRRQAQHQVACSRRPDSARARQADRIPSSASSPRSRSSRP